MGDHLSLASLLAKARQRCIWHLLLDHFALAASIAMAGAILLLLTGNQILNWYWIALLIVVAIGVGIYRMRSRVPSAYTLAQRIDRRLHLADALSTATYFSSPDAEHTRTEASVRERQKAEAEQAARTVDVRVAVPFTRSRFAYPAVGLALVAMGLFALRFAVTGSMSLEPSLVKMAFDTFFGSSNQQMAKNNRGKLPPNVKPPVDPGAPDSPSNANDLAPDSVLDSTEVPEVNPDMADQVKSASQGPQQHDQVSPEGENSEKGDKGQQGNDAGQENSPQNDKGDNNKNGKQPDKQNSKEGSGKESSLMDKLRDAMANMMNKLKPQKDGQQQNSQSAQQNGKQDSSNQKGQQQKNQSANADKEAQQDQQQGDQGDKKQSADAKSGEKSSDKSSPQDSKSGVGSEDGDKSAREAELLQAMGKLSEILGKRSANVSGEVMVEVGSTKQQLKTPFSQRQAKHADAGGEIHRDEVPLMYQQFVQQYFEEIRKSPASAAGKGAVSKEPASKDGKGAPKAKPAPAVP